MKDNFIITVTVLVSWTLIPGFPIEGMLRELVLSISYLVIDFCHKDLCPYEYLMQLSHESIDFAC